MAEFDALDSRLRDALARTAQPGDPTGVADAIRSRVAAGDPGTSVAGSTAPGWGGGVFSWLPWLAMIVVAGLVGVVVGVAGLVGRPPGEIVVDMPVAIGESAPASSCIDGPVVGRIGAGTRVLATARSVDSTWVAVRDPGVLGTTVWVRLGDVSLDAGAAALADLPVGAGCPETVVTVPVAPAPAPTEAPTSGDATAPTVVQAGAAPPTIWSPDGGSFFPGTSVVSAVAQDDIGVDRIVATWPTVDFVAGGSRSIAGASGSFPFGPVVWNESLGYADRIVPITLVAYDRAGNASSPVVVTITVTYYLG